MTHQRLRLIASVNPIWYQQIVSFVEENPEFGVLLPYASLTSYPIGFNKNPGEAFNPDAPRNIFETLIYSIAAAGVKMDYGYSQYKQIVSYLRTVGFFEENMEFPFKIQPKKLQVYKDLINILLQNNININQMKMEDLELAQQVKGIGVTTIGLCEELYGNGQVVPCTDSQWRKGFSKLYNIPKPTQKQILDVTNKWTNKKVGIMFINQCSRYY